MAGAARKGSRGPGTRSEGPQEASGPWPDSGTPGLGLTFSGPGLETRGPFSETGDGFLFKGRVGGLQREPLSTIPRAALSSLPGHLLPFGFLSN